MERRYLDVDRSCVDLTEETKTFGGKTSLKALYLLLDFV